MQSRPPRNGGVSNEPSRCRTRRRPTLYAARPVPPPRRFPPPWTAERIPTMELLAKIAAWIGACGLVIASWTPGEDMVRTALGGSREHFLAYFFTTGAFMLGYRDRAPWKLILALSALAAFLEVGQVFIPGRHASVFDWGSGVAGSVAACAIVTMLFSGRTATPPA